MVRLGQRRSDAWHRRIDAITLDKQVLTPEGLPNEDFPWAQLRLHTESYLKTKGRLTQDAKDERLRSLIWKHTARDVALAASVHSMSPEAARALVLSDLNVKPEQSQGLSPYLRAILATIHINPSAFDEVEATRARVLYRCTLYHPSAAARSIAELVPVLVLSCESTNELLYSHIHNSFQSACGDLALQLQQYRTESQWASAYTAIRALTRTWQGLLSEDGQVETVELMDGALPNWRSWAAWHPDLYRLVVCKRLDQKQCMALDGILALEGPDFSTDLYSTLKDAMVDNFITGSSIVNCGTLDVQLESGSAEELENLLQRLLYALEDAISRGSHYMNMFIHFCGEKVIRRETLEVVEEFNHLGASASEAAVQLIMARDTFSPEPIKMPMAAAIKLLPALCKADAQRLRNNLAPYIFDGFSKHLQFMQSELLAQLETKKRTWSASAAQLIIFGGQLKNIPWLQAMFSHSQNAVFATWPTLKAMATLDEIQQVVSMTASSIVVADVRKAVFSHPLTSMINSYCTDRLVKPGSCARPTVRLIKALIRSWQSVKDEPRREIALFICRLGDVAGVVFCRNCLTQIPVLPDDFVSDLRLILIRSVEDRTSSSACVELARLLASTTFTNAIPCWRPLLRRMIERLGPVLLEQTLFTLNAGDWMQWILDLSSIYGDEAVLELPRAPVVLQPSLHRWVHQLHPHSLVVIRLQKELNNGPALQCLLLGATGGQGEILLHMISMISEYEVSQVMPVLYAVLALLDREGSNAIQVCTVMDQVSLMTTRGADGVIRFLNIHKGSPELASAMLVIRLQDPDVAQEDRRALKAVAGVLGIVPSAHESLSDDTIEMVAAYLRKEAEDLMLEAQRLEGLRMALKVADPNGTSQLLASLGIEEPPVSHDAIALLPPTLVNFMEKISVREVEIQFPLMHLTALQRISMGAGDARSLFVRLILGDSSLPFGFCIHLDIEEIESQTPFETHSPWLVLPGAQAPNKQFCHGRANRCTYQLGRILFRHLTKGFRSLEDTYALLSNAIKDLAHSCVVCGASHGSTMHRSAICQTPQPTCTTLFDKTDEEVRLADLDQDHNVVDLLLTTVYMTARSGKLDQLLPDCPIRDTARIIRVVNALPKLSQPEVRNKMALKHSAFQERGELLTWLLRSYRGFLVSATDRLKIPNLPNTHQFLLANAAPDLESAFADRLAQHRLQNSASSSSNPSIISANQSTRVLFHGTSFDRLHAILCQGLRVCSGTTLQRNGAAYGKGVYMAEEPSTAWTYATDAPAAKGTPTTTRAWWTESAFRDVKVMLGCEAIVGDTSNVRGQKIHVVQDPSNLMVRYVWLMPKNGRAPLAAHVVPAMMSVFASLRSGSA